MGIDNKIGGIAYEKTVILFTYCPNPMYLMYAVCG